MTRAFDGVRVVDFTQVLSGPVATGNLAQLGADIIKIELQGTTGITFCPSKARFGWSTFVCRSDPRNSLFTTCFDLLMILTFWTEND